MNKGLKKILIIVAVILVIFMPLIGTYNKIVSMEQRVNSAYSNIDTNLQRRADLIGNLVETVKGYTNHERGVFKDIADARSKLSGTSNISEKANANNELSSALSRLLVVVENYPDLKSNQNFKDLSVALEGTENRIAISRQDYNNEVTKYNTSLRKFPNVIIANFFRFEQKSYFKAQESSKQVPKVNFSK